MPTWGLLFGILLIVGGFFVAPRSRWYWPQAILGTAFIIFAVSVVVRRVIPAQIAGSVPGGENGGAGTFLTDFLNDNTTGPMATRLLLMAFWAFVLAVLFAVIARFLPGWKEKYAAGKGGGSGARCGIRGSSGRARRCGNPRGRGHHGAARHGNRPRRDTVATVPIVTEVVAEPVVVESPLSAPATSPDEPPQDGTREACCREDSACEDSPQRPRRKGSCGQGRSGKGRSSQSRARKARRCEGGASKAGGNKAAPRRSQPRRRTPRRQSQRARASPQRQRSS